MADLEKAETQRPLIIERPDLQTISQRWGYRSVTLMAWILWFYLFMPVFSFIAWVAGLSLIYRLMLQDLSVSELWHIVSTYGLGIAFLASCYLVWALYSYIRFRGPDSRAPIDDVGIDALAEQHTLEASTVRHWQTQQKITVSGEVLKQMFEQKKQST